MANRAPNSPPEYYPYWIIVYGVGGQGVEKVCGAITLDELVYLDGATINWSSTFYFVLHSIMSDDRKDFVPLTAIVEDKEYKVVATWHNNHTYTIHHAQYCEILPSV